MVRTIRICSQPLIAALSLVVATGSAAAFAPTSRDIDTFADAWIAENADENRVASSKYLALLNREPGDASIATRLWESAVRAGDRAKALRAARTLELQGGSAESVLLLFGDAVQKRNWKAAESAIEALDDGNSYAFAAPLLAAWLRAAKGKRAAFEVPANNALLRFYSGDQPAYLALAAKDVSKAKSSLLQFAAMDNGYIVDLKLRAAPVLAARGEQAFVATMLEGLVPPDTVQKLSSSSQPRSLAQLEAADGLSAFYIRLASALIDQEAPAKGLALARIAVWLSPENMPARLVLARAFEAEGLANAAREMRDSIKEDSPYWARAAIEQVRALSDAGQHARAIGLAEKALAKRNSAEIAILLGQAQEAAGRLRDAEKTYRGLVQSADIRRIAPQRRAIYYLYLATVTDNLGDWERARTLLEKARTLDPQNAYVANYLGYSLLERGERLEDAVELIQRAHRLAPESMAITDSLGWGYFLSGDYEKAVKYLEKAARGSGSDLTINEHLGDAYWLSGRFVDARYAWRVASLEAEGSDAARLARKINLGLENGASRRN